MAGTTRFAEWLARLLAGDKSALGEALSIVERGGAGALRLLDRLHASSGRAQVVGITGAPGSGKSTLANALALHFAESGRRVGVIAVDPSSPFTGGAVLGDRVRMSRASGHERVFIRSAATRGSLGGLARTTHEFARVLDAVGYDPVIIETVGVGQSEIDIWKVAHTPVIIEAPGLGDAIQTMKAGVLEIAAILCVNKADLPGADATMLQLKELAGYASARTPGWEIPVLAAVAQSGKGVAELAERILAHGAWTRTSDRRAQLDRARSGAELRARLEADLVDAPLGEARTAGVLDSLIEAIAARRMTAAGAAEIVKQDFLFRLNAEVHADE